MKKLIIIGSLGVAFSAPLHADDELTVDGRTDRDRGTIYSPIGKRDPFKSPSLDQLGKDIAALNPLERFSIEQFQLRAILKGLGNSRAMLEDPEGHTYIIKEGMSVGRERATVSRILDKGLVLTERTFNYLGQESLYEKVISLPQGGAEGVVEDVQGGRRGKGGDIGGAQNGPNAGGVPVGVPFPFAAPAAGGGVPQVGGGNPAPAAPAAAPPQNNPAPAAPAAVPAPAAAGGGGNGNPLLIPQAPAAQNIGGGAPAAAPQAAPATITNKGGGLTY